MCGIVGICNFTEPVEQVRDRALKMAAKVRHRGPDWSGIYCDSKVVLAHERLSIVDVEHGAQPLFDKINGNVLCVNGEIYNHMLLRRKLKRRHIWQTKSDCEIILYLYDEYGPAFLNFLNGIFAFALYDKKEGNLFIVRDHIGINPLYIGRDDRGAVYVASEMKALNDYCTEIKEFPPGHYMISGQASFVRWYIPRWAEQMPRKKASLSKLRAGLEAAVKRQMMCDVPYGVLISGGLDSSLIAAIACKFRKRRVEAGDKEEAWWPRLHSFSVGLKDSPDLKHARRVANFLGTAHHEIVFTIEEGFNAIRDVIYHLETFDVTTVRAATPQYLMARKIRSMGIKMILTGEGADEIFGGYLYFHMAPNEKEFYDETIRKIFLLSKYDCLRTNKSTAAWGVEARVPFLDKEFLDLAMGLDPRGKMCYGDKIEKYLLRKAFEGYIPKEILWRQKEQFSDGVGYGWIDYLKRHAESAVTDEMMAKVKERFPTQTPSSKEEYFYREIFDSFFTNPTAVLTVPVGPTIACSTPTALKWSKEFADMADPSGRSVKGIHEHALEKV